MPNPRHEGSHAPTLGDIGAPRLDRDEGGRDHVAQSLWQIDFTYLNNDSF